MTSFMFLVTPCASLSITVKHTGLSVCCRMAMMVYWGWSPEMFPQPVPYVFLWTVDVSAFKPVDTTFLKFVVSVLKAPEEALFQI